jgi:methionyl-tRNA formyltransferase
VRTVFFGSPEFAVPALEALIGDRGFEVALVVTQGTKGRSPVEIAADRAGISIYKPATLRDPASRQPLIDVQADLFVVAAFGLIFRPRTLQIPRLGAINIHPSLLPKYRGASPIMAPIQKGDEETGVSLIVMDAGIDTGDVISVARVEIASDDTTETLGGRLARVAANQLLTSVPRWISGKLGADPQRLSGASMTRPLTKLDGLIDWRDSAVQIERHVRAMWPWPRAWSTLGGAPMQVHRASIVHGDVSALKPGDVIEGRKRLVIATGDQALELEIIEPAGRRAMAARAFLNGHRSPVRQLGDPGVFPSRPPLIVPV